MRRAMTMQRAMARRQEMNRVRHVTSRLLAVVVAGCLGLLATPEHVDAQEGKAKPAEDAKKSAEADEKAAGKKEEIVAIVGGTVYPVTSPPIHRGTVIIRGKKIEAVGPELSVPDGAKVINAEGKHVSPGFVAADTSGLGLGSSGSDAAYRLDPYERNLHIALATGITTANVSGGGGFVFFGGGFVRRSTGMSILLKLTRGDLESMVLRAAGLNNYSLPSSQVLLNTYNAREGFREAKEYLKAAAEAKAKKAKPPRMSSRIASYVTILKNEQPTMVGVGSVPELQAVLDLHKAYPFDLVISGTNRTIQLAPELARRRIPVVSGVRGPGFSFDLASPVVDEDGLVSIRRPAAFTRAGVEVSLHTGTKGVSLMGLAGRDLTALGVEAGFAARGGLSEEEALKCITINPARLLKIDDRVGSLEPGKDADVLILSRDPLDYRAFVLKALINGKVYYEREKSRLFRDVPLK